MEILIVDDHQIFRASLIRFLKSIIKASHNYYEAGNGQEALEKLQASSFDLVFLDVSMPIMDGYETCTAIRQGYPELPIIILTQYDDHHLICHFVQAGIKSFLTKDASETELISAIDCALRGETFFLPDVKKIIESAGCQRKDKPAGSFISGKETHPVSATRDDEQVHCQRNGTHD